MLEETSMFQFIQLFLLCVVLSSHFAVCAYHPWLITRNVYALNKYYALNRYMHLTTQLYGIALDNFCLLY